MLTGLEKVELSVDVCRLANARKTGEALNDLGVGFDDLLTTMEFIGDGAAGQAEKLLDAPFSKNRSKDAPFRKGRFGNGFWPVYYSALEWETTVAECGHWHQREAIGTPEKPLVAHYQAVRCRLAGAVLDVRPKVLDWPFLVGDDEAYRDCQKLAGTAIDLGADALFCPSARHPAGTTSPVFRRHALSNPRIVGRVKLSLSPDGAVVANWLRRDT